MAKERTEEWAAEGKREAVLSGQRLWPVRSQKEMEELVYSKQPS